MPPTPTATKKKAQALAAQLRVAMKTRPLYDFCNGVIFYDRQPNAVASKLHRKMLDWADAQRERGVRENLYLVSRGHQKTATLTVAQNIQRVLRNPNIRILIASTKLDMAEKMLEEIKGHLQNNEWLQRAFPDLLLPPGEESKYPEWTKTAITLRRPNRKLRGSTISVTGVTGELVSAHYDHATWDDLVGKENSATKDEREKVIDFFRKAQPLLDPGATQDAIGTCWHYADLYAYLQTLIARGQMPMGTFKMPCWLKSRPTDPLAADVPGFGWVRPSLPEFFTMDELLRRRAVMGSSEFAAQYLLDPVSADTAHFKRENLILEDARPPLDDLWIAMTVDPAISTKAWADYSAIAIGGFDSAGDLWLLELLKERRDDVALVRRIFECAARFPSLRVIGFEAVGFAKIFKRLIHAEGERRGRVLPFIGLERDTKITKNVRIGGLQAPWENKQIHALRSCVALDDLLDEADKFRPDRESDSDDLLDAVADLYQLRAKPSPGPKQEDWRDAELAERIAWEREHPDLDPMSLRVGWLHEQHRRLEAQRREELAVGGGGDEFWG